jgi:hypothetical protein
MQGKEQHPQYRRYQGILRVQEALSIEEDSFRVGHSPGEEDTASSEGP